MKKIAVLSIFGFFVWTSTPASAQDWNCSDPGNLPQQGMNFCAFRDYEKADAELNGVWKNVFPKLKAYDAELDASYRGLPEAVLEAQRAWIAYRDAHCKSEGFKFRGGTMEPLIYHSCRANLSRERSKQLNNLLEDG